MSLQRSPQTTSGHYHWPYNFQTTSRPQFSANENPICLENLCLYIHTKENTHLCALSSFWARNYTRGIPPCKPHSASLSFTFYLASYSARRDEFHLAKGQRVSELPSVSSRKTYFYTKALNVERKLSIWWRKWTVNDSFSLVYLLYPHPLPWSMYSASWLSRNQWGEGDVEGWGLYHRHLLCIDFTRHCLGVHSQSNVGRKLKFRGLCIWEEDVKS